MKHVENQLTELTFPIGKHKGEPIQQVLADTTYCNWIIKQEWFNKQYPYLQKFIISSRPKQAKKKSKKVIHRPILHVKANPVAICLN